MGGLQNVKHHFSLIFAFGKEDYYFFSHTFYTLFFFFKRTIFHEKTLLRFMYSKLAVVIRELMKPMDFVFLILKVSTGLTCMHADLVRGEGSVSPETQTWKAAWAQRLASKGNLHPCNAALL